MQSSLLSENANIVSETVFTVAELTNQIKGVLEGTFPSIWVSGEMSNLSRPSSGHIYFTLKDESAQIRAVIWRNLAARLNFDLVDGLEVVCRGDVEVYAPRGSYQLILRELEPKGLGALQLAFRRLHTQLAAEGIFDDTHKKPLPRFPRRIAVVTSPSGAAIRDLWEVMRRRWSDIEVLLIPSRVQGEGAADEIVRGIETANRLTNPPDLLIVCRGGGSIEDLWCFNEEQVVRAIHASALPVVSAVGHEIDVTLSDLVADVRALTPSEAGEIVLPSLTETERRLGELRRRLALALRRQSVQARARLEAIAERRLLRHPEQRIHDAWHRLEELDQRNSRALRHCLQRADERVGSLAAQLESLSPLAVLARGYSLTRRTRDGQLIQQADTLTVGEEITTTVDRGEILSRVESVDPLGKTQSNG